MGESATYTQCVLALDMTIMAFRRLDWGVTVTQRERHAGSACRVFARSIRRSGVGVCVCVRARGVGWEVGDEWPRRTAGK